MKYYGKGQPLRRSEATGKGLTLWSSISQPIKTMSITIQKLIQEVKENNPNADNKLIKKAFYFAKKAHQGQKRESGEDYIE